ncbi:TPA: hypothetical protein L4F09_006202 [Pseudomonas aeruginosa]|nr:hypothetical protein [Pseudomonas aeruginosa]
MKISLITNALLAFMALPALSVAAEQPQQPVYVDPLSLYVRTSWPEDVKTIGQAARYVLEPTGYRFVTQYPAPSDAIKFANRAIPPIVKLHRTMPVIDALQLLVGVDNYVIVDHNHKLVSISGSK